MLDDVCLQAEVGQIVALVGHSGCGKSTIVQLLQCFYDPKSGAVTIDGVNLRDYNVRWLRQNIGDLHDSTSCSVNTLCTVACML